MPPVSRPARCATRRGGSRWPVSWARRRSSSWWLASGPASDKASGSRSAFALVPAWRAFPNVRERLGQVRPEIVDCLDSNGEPDEAGSDADLIALLGGQAALGGASRIHHQALDIADRWRRRE